MSVVVNNLRLIVKRDVSQGKIVQEVRVKGTNAHVDCQRFFCYDYGTSTFLKVLFFYMS